MRRRIAKISEQRKRGRYADQTGLCAHHELAPVHGVGDTVSSILRSTINQLSTPDELRRRMSSINNIFTSNGPQCLL